MEISAVFRFIASNPPSILILGAILGWVLCGFTSIKVLCDYWLLFLILGVVIQLIWMFKDRF